MSQQVKRSVKKKNKERKKIGKGEVSFADQTTDLIDILMDGSVDLDKLFAVPELPPKTHHH